MKPSRPRPNDPQLIRPAVLPGVLGSLATLSGLFLFGTDWFITIQFAVSILAAIVGAFALQSRTTKGYITVPFLAAVVVVWNPIVNLSTAVASALGPQGWMLAEIAAAVIIFVSGVLIKTIAPTR